MTDVRGFRGLRFNVHAHETLDAGKVTCPPYDVISPEAQAEYHARSPWNIVRVELGFGPTDLTLTSNRYAAAAATLASWQEEGVLLRDPVPAMYLHEHEFVYEGRRRVRRGIMVAGRLHDWSEGEVRPHEHTRAGPKADRLALLEATATNTSPLWLIYHDIDGAVATVLAEAWNRAPDLVSDADEEIHRLIVVNDSKVVESVRTAFATRPTYIADGHHRYETATRYRDDCRARSNATGQADAEAPYEFALWLLVDAADPGLVVRPYHRVIAATGVALDEAIAALRQDADLRAIDPALGVTGVMAALNESDHDELVCVLWARGRAWRVTPRPHGEWRERLPDGPSDAWLSLDVVAIDSLVVREAFGIDASVEEPGASAVPRLRYSPDVADALRQVDSGMAEVAVLVRPVRVAHVCAVADAGDRMPPKSTYFHPKPATGLVLNPLV
jgi:uncharacterized protein (DUF1015 family)